MRSNPSGPINSRLRNVLALGRINPHLFYGSSLKSVGRWANWLKQCRVVALLIGCLSLLNPQLDTLPRETCWNLDPANGLCLSFNQPFRKRVGPRAFSRFRRRKPGGPQRRRATDRSSGQQFGSSKSSPTSASPGKMKESRTRQSFGLTYTSRRTVDIPAALCPIAFTGAEATYA